MRRRVTNSYSAGARDNMAAEEVARVVSLSPADAQTSPVFCSVELEHNAPLSLYTKGECLGGTAARSLPSC